MSLSNKQTFSVIGAFLFTFIFSQNPVFLANKIKPKIPNSQRYEIYLKYNGAEIKNSLGLIQFIEDFKKNFDLPLKKMREHEEFFTPVVNAFGRQIEIRVAFTYQKSNAGNVFSDLSLTFNHLDKPNLYSGRYISDFLEEFYWDEDEDEVYRFLNGDTFHDKLHRLIVERFSKQQ